MVVAPHAGLAVGNLCSGRNVVPSVRPVINAVQQQPFVIGLEGEIGFLEQPRRDGQPSGGVEFCAENMSQAKQSLGRDRAGGRIDRLVVIVGIGRFRPPIAQAM
jgi:hypothetical protein